MLNKEVANYHINTFDQIKHIDEEGNEYWEARELQPVLEYTEWRKFEGVINKAKLACINSNYRVSYHFGDTAKTIKMPKSAKKIVNDYKLSRYACYLIVQNADPRKNAIAFGQTYFAIQTRKQEITEEEYNKLSEIEKRLYRRKQTRGKNLMLYQTAKKAGVKNFDKFTNAGYKGLYNGEKADDIAKRKGLRYREEILDNMGSEELSANLFRIDQTEAKLKRDNIKTEVIANDTHYKVGKAVRDTIKKLGGTMPENLPTPNKSLKETSNKVVKTFSQVAKTNKKDNLF